MDPSLLRLLKISLLSVTDGKPKKKKKKRNFRTNTVFILKETIVNLLFLHLLLAHLTDEQQLGWHRLVIHHSLVVLLWG